jgi:hypothetical protein
MCARGSRAFFLSQGWDWTAFLENGIDIEIVEKPMMPWRSKLWSM